MSEYERKDGQKNRQGLKRADTEKIDFLNEALGPDEGNIACDLDRIQYDNVYKRVISFEFELENHVDPWKGGYLFNPWTTKDGEQMEAAFKTRTFAYLLKWHLITSLTHGRDNPLTKGSMFIVIYPSKYKRSQGRDRVLMIEVLKMNFDEILVKNEWKMTVKSWGEWCRSVNVRCNNIQKDYITGRVGFSYSDSEKPTTQPYEGVPGADTRRNDSGEVKEHNGPVNESKPEPEKSTSGIKDDVPSVDKLLVAPGNSSPKDKRPGEDKTHADSNTGLDEWDNTGSRKDIW